MPANIHDKLDMFEEAGEAVELAEGVDQLLEVVEARLGLGPAILLEHVGIAGLVENDLREFVVRHAVIQPVAPHIDLVDELGEAALGRAFDLVGLQDHRHEREERAAVLAGKGLQLLDCGRADAALGLVDDALKGEVIVGRADQAEIGEGIADFGALEEARTANDAVGDAQHDEALFEEAHLPGGADQDSAVFILAALVHIGFDVVADEAGFGFAIPEAAHLHLVGVRVRARLLADIERLAEPALVEIDDRRGSGENVRR